MALFTTALAVTLFAVQEPKRLDYSILYAGAPGSVREKAFTEFFKTTFKQSATTDIAKFDGSQAKGYDVVFLDFRSGNTARKKLPATYKTSTVVCGWEGVFTVDEGRTAGANYW
jgi:hypothetical protein